MAAPRRDERVRELRMYVERLVGGNRPRRRRPDHRVRSDPSGARAEPERARKLSRARRIRRAETDVDRDIDAILVLDFRFGERAAAIEAPIDRLQAAIQVTAFQHLAERADLVRLAL
mgnify:CR=1 FL=1